MTLFLLPNLLHPESDEGLYLPKDLKVTLESLQGIFVESEKGARLLLKRLDPVGWRTLPLVLLGKEDEELLQPLLKGERWGLLVDAGLPCLADPGSRLVARARKRNIPVVALSGPSSLVLALERLGFPAQAFAFHGYLPHDERALAVKLRSLERLALEGKMTQLFIESPYRSLKLFQLLLKLLQPKTVLGIATDLTSKDELLLAHSVAKWATLPPPPIERRPTLFLFSYSN